MMVQFMGQHTSLLNHLVPPPHNLFATLANLTIKMVYLAITDYLLFSIILFRN